MQQKAPISAETPTGAEIRTTEAAQIIQSAADRGMQNRVCPEVLCEDYVRPREIRRGR
jgi:hypothetical protein